jgi:hypothetical protein
MFLAAKARKPVEELRNACRLLVLLAVLVSVLFVAKVLAVPFAVMDEADIFATVEAAGGDSHW